MYFFYTPTFHQRFLIIDETLLPTFKKNKTPFQVKLILNAHVQLSSVEVLANFLFSDKARNGKIHNRCLMYVTAKTFSCFN